MSLGFKDVLKADIDTFLNPEEFAERHLINGREMSVSIDGNEVVERSKKQTEKGRVDGIYEQQIMLYVSREQLGRMPAIGSMMTVDTRRYLVEDAIHEAGIYSILLGAVRS